MLRESLEAHNEICSFPLIFTMLNMLLLWVRLYPPNSYVEVFTPSTSESDLTWK